MSDSTNSKPETSPKSPQRQDEPGQDASAEAPNGGGSGGQDTDLKKGLTEAEAAERLSRYGPNAIEEKSTSLLARLLSFFWGPIPWMIEIAAVLSAVVQHWEDFTIILIMLMINAGVGFFEEFKADRAIAALKQTLALKARVLRDGSWRVIAAREVVPGDVVLLRLGNIIPADVRLAEGDYLSIDQSALTGESLPVEKAVGDTAYASSVAKMGEMKAVVTATGAETYFGRTAKLVEGAGTTSHFQRAVLRIGNFLIMITLGLVALILLVALFRHDPLVDTILFALILTVAAIPVALPAVLSVTMAVGAVKLARMKAIVSRLVAIEEMAGMDVLCSDKTGTLTKNQLVVGDPEVTEAENADDLILAAALASQTDNDDDPIDKAVLEALGDRSKLEAYTTARFKPFDPVRKRSEAEIDCDGERFSVTKGAPQVILDVVEPKDDTRREVESQVEALAEKGYRTLGVARRDKDGAWRFLGLLPLFDPPRDDSAETIERAKAMGLDVKMVTGDNTAIAREIAGKLDIGKKIVPAGEVFDSDGGRRDSGKIENANGFAEVFPEHKFNIVEELQSRGHIVGMTGDGVNDAPALKQADIGFAVSGATDAARAAADIVLTEAGLSVITQAIEEARRIFERMTSYAIFRIAETIRVMLFMTLSILVFNFYPVTAVMIVLLAVLNDFPIMMIAYDNTLVAARPVRWDMHRVLTFSIVLGVLGVIASFGLFWIAEEYLKLSRDMIQTLIFLKLLVAGHLTIYLTRNKGWFWDRPWPNWRLFVTTETTQVLGTLAAVYGWYVTPIGWTYALAIWAYALVEFLIVNALKIAISRLIQERARHQTRHIGRIQAWLTPR
jgi:H+-transporting ATPase